MARARIHPAPSFPKAKSAPNRARHSPASPVSSFPYLLFQFCSAIARNRAISGRSFYRKERKEHKDKSLRRFFSALHSVRVGHSREDFLPRMARIARMGNSLSLIRVIRVIRGSIALVAAYRAGIYAFFAVKFPSVFRISRLQFLRVFFCCGSPSRPRSPRRGDPTKARVHPQRG